MREIKFRGRGAPRGKQWFYGDLDTHTSGVCILDNDTLHTVISETVGQFTGLKDCEGREIYEGDVIRSYFTPHMRPDVCNGYVVYENGAFYVEYIDHTYANLGDLIFYSGTTTSVIGNIHDNPELLYNDEQSAKSEEVES